MSSFRTISFCGCLLAGLVLAMAGCDTLPPGPQAGPPTEPLITAISDPDNPMVAEVVAPGGKAALYGTRNARGIPDHIDSLIMESSEDGRTYSAAFDDGDRPTFIADDAGNILTLSYSETHVILEFLGEDGSELKASAPLNELPDFPDGKPRVSAKLKASSDMPMNDAVRKITVRVNVNMFHEGQNLGQFSDAAVYGEVQYGVGGRRSTYSAFSKTLRGPGPYEFRHRHNALESPSLEKAACEEFAKDMNNTSRIMTHSGTALATLSFICLTSIVPSGGTTAALCAFLTSINGTAIGLGIAATGSVATERAIFADCESLAVIPADPGSATIKIVAIPNVANTQPRQQTRTVDLTALSAPYLVEFDFDYDLPAGILTITTDPSAPTSFGSYRAVFEVIPPGASVSWSVKGSDDFTTSGLADGSPGQSTVYSSSIPGGAATVSDTITAQVEVKGVKVGETKTKAFEFR